MVFIIIFAIIFALFMIQDKVIPYHFLEKFQYYELFFGSILIIFLFGYFQSLIYNDSSYLSSSFTFATFFLIWIFSTRLLTNFINRDMNGYIRF